MDLSDYALISISVVLIATSIAMIVTVRCCRRTTLEEIKTNNIVEW